MLDVTWEAPDGVITPLDGYLDGYFQEVYLDAESAPIFSKLVKQVSTDVMDDYVARLEKEVKKCVKGEKLNYGKAAKRLYNIFRLNGRYEEAAFLRELFDEPAALLYASSVTLREGNLHKPYQSINTSYLIRKTWWLYLLLEKNLAISFAGAVGNRFVYKSSLRSEMANVFGE
jgi:hypothetical protein